MAFGTVSADVIQTSTAGGVLGAGNASIMKNRLINGAMVIDQRNAGASVTATVTNAATYTLDRWAYSVSQASKFTIQQNAGSVTPPAGFKNYLGCTSSSAYTVGSAEIFTMVQAIEGYNVADLGWGTASAKTVTLSFQVYSSLTGTFGGSITNSAVNRCYPFSYSIPVANTWTTISVTLAGDTTGTWLTTNGIGLYVFFGLGCGASVSGTAGAWVGSFAASATGATSVVGTNGATFYITGVQLEVGSSATGYEYRQYGQELLLCQRYAQPIGQGTVGRVYSATEVEMSCMFRTEMRSAPTITFGGFSGASTAVNQNPGVQMVATAISTAGIAKTTGTYLLYTVSSGTTGNIATVWNGNTCFASAEL